MLSTRYFDKMRFDTVILYLDNNTITKVAQPLDDSILAENLMAQLLSSNVFPKQLEVLITQWLADNSIL